MKQPEEYLPQMTRLRQRNKYAKTWVMQIKRFTNRHPESSGGSWGWYEIWPLKIVIGHWNNQKNDLYGVDIEAWNLKAQKLTAI